MEPVVGTPVDTIDQCGYLFHINRILYDASRDLKEPYYFQFYLDPQDDSLSMRQVHKQSA